jgi:hypothetical protein
MARNWHRTFAYKWRGECHLQGCADCTRRVTVTVSLLLKEVPIKTSAAIHRRRNRITAPVGSGDIGSRGKVDG